MHWPEFVQEAYALIERESRKRSFVECNIRRHPNIRAEDCMSAKQVKTRCLCGECVPYTPGAGPLYLPSTPDFVEALR